MNKVFIDLGGNAGQTVIRFYEEVPDASNWIIYSFEPLMFDLLLAGTKKYRKRYSNVNCIKAAAGKVSGKTRIYPSLKKHSPGSTILLGKTTGSIFYEGGIEVNEIDFVPWFKENTQPDDFVILKMNIEGGEYDLMPGLLEIMPRIAGLYIKLHHYKFENSQRLKMLQIYEDFKLNIQKYTTFAFCDAFEGKDESKGNYRFLWMLQEIEKHSKSICSG